jgi:hypothetical protein
MMDGKKMGKQMIDFYKTTFDNSFSTMLMLQEQMERMAEMFWGQMVNVPAEVKKAMAEWTKNYHKGCEEFKKVVDNGFKNLESLAA